VLDINLIRNDRKSVINLLSRRGADFSAEIEEIANLDSGWRRVLSESEELKRLRNEVSDEIGLLKREGGDASEKISSMKEISLRIKELDSEAKEFKEKSDALLLGVPNIPAEGLGYDNSVIRDSGPVPEPGFEYLPHWELGEMLGILDFEKAALLSGSRFPLLKGDGCRLERALASFMLDLHTEKHGYTEIIPPFLVREEVMTGTGQLPKFREDMYGTEDDGLFLIPTAEVPLTNMHRGGIIDPDDLPLKYTALTPCFRREAGSYGKDTRGLIRNHQFSKVELVNITSPEDSENSHLTLLRESEEVLKLLGLPYRVLLLGSSDMGFSASKTYDLEVWMPGEGLWREVSSCSNCGDFQARRMETRTRGEDSTTVYAHTLNSSGLAVGRIFAALLENFQTQEAGIRIPEVLSSYMKGRKLIERP